MKFQIAPIRASSFNLDNLGDTSFQVNFIAPLNSCDKTTITFYKGDDLTKAKSIAAGILILDQKFKESLDKFESEALVFTNNPMLLFAQIINENYSNEFTDNNVSADFDQHLVSGESYIEDQVVIGNGTRVYPKATIFNGTTLGDNCTVQSGTVLGGIGMSYTKDEKGVYHKMTHLGSLKIADAVDIGTNTSVLRGILETTVIGEGTKIGNNVNVGHNVVIGKNCYISSGVTIGGACTIGDNCWISPGVTLTDHLTVGNNSKIGAGSVVLKDIISDSFYLGNPARKIR